MPNQYVKTLLSVT